MNQHERFCRNERCWAYGRAGEGHVVIHSRKERRYRCKRCEKTFSETKGTALYRIHKPHELVATVVTLLAYGCPVQAVVAAFGLDERTVARWRSESGWHCRRVHEHLVQAGGCAWRTFRPTNCASASSAAAFCGWPRRFRSRAAFGWAGWCNRGGTAL